MREVGQDTVVMSTKGLDELIMAFSGKIPVGRIGVLGKKDTRRGKKEIGKSNATIAAVHEYGDTTHPIRSFLRIPLTEHLEKYLQNAGAFNVESLKIVMKERSIIPWMKKFMAVAETVVQHGFSSNGFGKWPAWKDSSYENNTGMILVDTQQLRGSITTDLKG